MCHKDKFLVTLSVFRQITREEARKSFSRFIHINYECHACEVYIFFTGDWNDKHLFFRQHTFRQSSSRLFHYHQSFSLFLSWFITPEKYRFERQFFCIFNKFILTSFKKNTQYCSQRIKFLFSSWFLDIKFWCSKALWTISQSFSDFLSKTNVQK